MRLVPDWVRKLFTEAARRRTAEEMKDPAHVEITGHRLKSYADEAGEERFIPAKTFLAALETAARESPLSHPGTSAAGTRKTARITLINAMVSGQCPFLYAAGHQGPLYVEDAMVPVKFLARRALNLLDRKETALAGIYLQALERGRDEICPLNQALSRELAYEEGQTVDARFEYGIADGGHVGSRSPVSVLRPRHFHGP